MDPGSSLPPLGKELNQTQESCGHPVFITMQGHARKGDGKKDENKAEHDGFPNFSSQGDRGESFGHFPESLNSFQT
jgi:hypothetical protein